jgi:predicted amidophosphoribosyltransferase
VFSVPLMAIVNICRGVKNLARDGLEELSDKIHAKRLEYEAKEAAESRAGVIVCTTCGTDANASAQFCHKCGAAITSSACRACGGSVQPEGSQYCSRCGTSQSQSAAT